MSNRLPSNLSGPLSTTAEVSHAGYSGVARWLHWITALGIFTVIPIAWYINSLDKGAPSRGNWYMLHKSIGITILALTLIRLLTRAIHPPPPLPAGLPDLEKRLTQIWHFLLYFILLAMPLSGYLGNSTSGRSLVWFGWFTVPNLLSANRAFSHLAYQFHSLLAYLAYLLIAGHVLAAAYHAIIRRDGIVSRIIGKTQVKSF